jgi:diguanylate cyclase (GGDEF)-like protein
MRLPELPACLRLNRASAAVVGACGLILAAGWGLALERISYERAQAEADAYRTTSNLALAFEQDVVRTLDALQNAMLFALHEYEARGASADLEGSLSAVAHERGPFTSFSIVDRRGDKIVSTRNIEPVNLADREYFRYHAANPDSALRVDAPVLGRLSGRPAIPVSRRIDLPDGNFGGILLAGVAPRYFTDFFQRLDLGEEGLVQLVGADGIVRARRAGKETSWGGDLSASQLLRLAAASPQGEFASAGRLDGVTRYMSYRRLAGQPLFVTVGVSMREVLAPYEARKRSYLAVAAAASLLVLLAGAGILARMRAETELARAAHFDRVTGLPNRALCFDRLKQAIAQARRPGSLTGLLLLDMDRFKNINDTLGHPGGDAILRATADRLAHCVRAGDTVARIGGDEFAIVLHLLHRPDDAAVVAKKILAAMGRPVLQGGQEIFAGASIGIAICPPDGAAPETLMRNADAALLQAKKAGRGTFQFYTAEMNTRAAERLALERDLRKALERGEFMLHYQPKVRIATGEVAGFEALLRWSRPGSDRPVSPAEFVPVLEESGFIREVGAWAIGVACRQLRAWRDAGYRPVPVAVNVAAKQFNAEFPGIVSAALRRYGLEAALLIVEITESDAMADPDRALKVLDDLRALGVAVSVDDFGTGYSSLGYLKRFQPSELKIDRSFVAGLPEDADNVSITRAVISMAHSLGMHVVAEGVETAAQRGFLRHHGCEQMQGYLFSKPLPADDCLKFLSPLPSLAEAV